MDAQITFSVGGVPEHFNLPWHLAVESGAFAKSGLNVDFHEFPGGTGALTNALADRQLDAALVLSEGAVADILKRGHSRLVKVYVRSPLVWGIHVASDSDIHSIEQVQCKRYAISRNGSGSHLMAIVDAAQRGWPTEQMKFVVVGGLKGAREALPKGDAEIFLWEKFMTKPYVDNGEFRRVDCSSAAWPSFVVAVRNDVLENNPESIRTMLNVVDQQAAALMADRSAVSLISSRYGLQQDDTAEWFGQTEWGSGFECPVVAIEEILHYLNDLGIVDNRAAQPADVWFELPPAN